MTAPVRAPIEVQFRATGVEQVRNGLRLVSSDAGSAHDKVARGAQTAANAIAEMAHSGEVGGRGIRELVRAGAEMALEFGVGGPVLAALGLLGVAVYSHITNRMKEARDEIAKTRKEIGDMANTGDAKGLNDRARDAWFGTPYDAKGNFRGPSRGVAGAFEGSLVDLRSRKAFLESKLLPKGFLSNEIQNQGIFKAIREMQPQLDAAELKFRQIQTALDVMEVRPGGAMFGMKITAQTLEAEAAAGQRAIDAMMDMIAKSMPRFHDVASSDQMRAILAAQDANDLNKLLIKYNPGVDHSKARDQMKEMGYGMHATAAIIKPTDTQRIVADFEEKVQRPLGEAIQKGMAQTIGSAISNGITAGFESGSIVEGFKAGGKAILAGVGGILTQMGQVWISYGISMTALGEALWNPLTSGPAAIAIGASLIALGSALGAVAHGRGGAASGSSISSSAPQIIDRGIINPSSIGAVGGLSIRTPINVTIIGPNDPVAQRQIGELIRNADRRSAA